MRSDRTASASNSSLQWIAPRPRDPPLVPSPAGLRDRGSVGCRRSAGAAGGHWLIRPRDLQARQPPRSGRVTDVGGALTCLLGTSLAWLSYDRRGCSSG